MTQPPHDPTSALFEAARGYVAAFQPGRLAARVIVVMEDGKKAIDASVAPAVAGRPGLRPV